jgi:hypothetical protein
MFPDRLPAVSNDVLPVAKRGNLLFIRNEHVFVISIELAEKVIEGKSYGKNVAEQDEILRKRLLEMVDKITFLKPATPAKK